MELTHFSGKHVEHLLPPASYIVKMSGFLRVYIIANWIPLVVDSWPDKTSNFNMSRWVLGNRVDRFFFLQFSDNKMMNENDHYLQPQNFLFSHFAFMVCDVFFFRRPMIAERSDLIIICAHALQEKERIFGDLSKSKLEGRCLSC